MNDNNNEWHSIHYFFSEGRTEVVSSSEQIAGTEEDAPTESTDRKQEKKDEDEQGTVNTSNTISGWKSEQCQ